MKLIFSNHLQIEKVFKSTKECESIEHIVLMEESPPYDISYYEEKLKSCTGKNVRFHFFNQLLMDEEKWIPLQKKNKSDISTLVYTSGSTGYYMIFVFLNLNKCYQFCKMESC
jgi:long-subunit acyl-CoA synthetase (AMP-forming)